MNMCIYIYIFKYLVHGAEHDVDEIERNGEVDALLGFLHNYRQ